MKRGARPRARRRRDASRPAETVAPVDETRADIPAEPAERRQPASTDIERPDEHAPGSIEGVARSDADGGVDASFNESGADDGARTSQQSDG